MLPRDVHLLSFSHRANTNKDLSLKFAPTDADNPPSGLHLSKALLLESICHINGL